MDTDRIPAVVAGLRAAFDSGRTRPLAWRREQLRGLVALCEAHSAELEGALAADLGKPRAEARLAEIGHVASEARAAERALAGWAQPQPVGTPLALWPASSRIQREPLGVVLVIGPWNYPVELACAPLVGALAAGNAVLLKPSEVAAHTSAALATLLPRYLDREAVAVVEGGVDVARAVLAQRFDHVFFTGSTAVGRIVMEAAAKHLTPVTLELGGKSPCLVDATARLDVSARRIAWGKFSNAGQTCVAPDYLLVEAGVHDALVARLVATVQAFYGADPRSSPDYGRIASDRHHARLVGLLDRGTVACGGQHDATSRYLAPTILTDVSPDDPVMADEIFGPILPVLKVRDMDEAIRFVNARPKPLALYLFSESRRARDQVVGRTSSGAAVVNHGWLHMANSELPFGGVGDSGQGAYHGRFSFEAMSHRKAVLLASTALDPPLLYPPYTPAKLGWLEWLLG